MNIQNHIRNLLYRNDCVIVEGFGAFVCQRQSARIEDGVFFPPRKIVNFNSGLKVDDGLLANHIAIQEKVSFQIARQHIRAFSDQLQAKLTNENALTIKHLGRFTISKEQTIIFSPDQDHDWLLEAYGLPHLRPEVVEKEVVIEEKIEVVPVVALKTKRPNIWRYAAIGIIAVGIVGILGSEKFKSDVAQHNLVQEQKAKEIVQKTIQESSFVLNDPLAALTVEVEVEKPKGPYHIIGGAFRVKENAEKKIKSLHEIGFQAHYLGENKYGLHQVAYSSYSDRQEALQALRTIKKENNPDAWLFVKEL